MRHYRSLPAAVILSPHPDDAVLSLWHLLTGPGEVRVINVFGGAPAAGSPLGWWDRLTGARDPVERAHERDAEDRRALARAGRRPVSLDLPGGQYRGGDREVGPIAEGIAGLVSAGDLVYAPASLDGHRSHRLVLEAARRALDDDAGGLRLYADIPHALAFGWPAWVTGAAADPRLDPDAHWDHQLRAVGLSADDLEPEVHRLPGEAIAAKREAIREYASQLPALEAQFGPFTDDATLAYEVVWSPRRSSSRRISIASERS